MFQKGLALHDMQESPSNKRRWVMPQESIQIVQQIIESLRDTSTTAHVSIILILVIVLCYTIRRPLK